MASKERSYTATGRTVVAFETETAGNQAVGVGVNGTECGVHGEGGLNPSGTRTHPPFTGVHGRGDFTGVAGEGGLAGAMHKGIVGCYAEGGIGVLSKGSLVGLSAEGTIGLNVDGGIFGIIAKGAIGAGVTAVSSTAAGVSATSQSGPGVEGTSKESKGGIFESGEVAQIQLVPSTKRFPPATGQVGDLFMSRDAREPNLPSSISLFLCVIDGAPKSPAQWVRVLLDTVLVSGR